MFNISLKMTLTALKHSSRWSAVAVLALLPINGFSATVTDMLKQADAFRLAEGSSKVVTEVQLFESDELTSQHQYHVYTRPSRESLVVFKAASEEGQKMLMLQDKYWLLMPRSRRPIRITPMQKLLGEASVGDISTLTWSQDYNAELEGSEIINQQHTQRLRLQAKTRGASYYTITLWLQQEDNFPLKAELYLKSGKLAKVAWFTAGVQKGLKTVSEMRLEDAIQTNKTTRIKYVDSRAHQLPDKFYNPAYLSRQSVAHL